MYLRKQLEDLDLHVVQAEDKKEVGGWYASIIIPR